MNIVNVTEDISEFLVLPSGTGEAANQYFCTIPKQSCTSSSVNRISISTVNTTNNEEVTSSQWTREHSLILIDCYKICRRKVGQMEMKNLKKMWEVIAGYILENYKLKYTPQNCENRWRVLERNYKKYIENNSKTGRGRKYFEFAKEMDEIFKKKRNIHPEILLTSSGAIKSNSGSELETTAIEKPESEISVEPLIETQITSPPTPTLKKKRLNIKYTKDDILQQIRIDRKQYQEERLQLERQKIEHMLEIAREKLEIRKKNNNLLEIRNNLLEKISFNINTNSLSLLQVNKYLCSTNKT